MIESAMIFDRMSGATVSVTKGTAGRVGFDFDAAWKHLKRTGRKADSLHFVHVHPSGLELLSAMDIDCMDGFGVSFGGGFLFSVICFENDRLDDFTSRQRTCTYSKRHHKVDLVATLKYDIRGWLIDRQTYGGDGSRVYLDENRLMVLKALSYAEFIEDESGHQTDIEKEIREVANEILAKTTEYDVFPNWFIEKALDDFRRVIAHATTTPDSPF